jgi:hypothetical protein
VRDTARAIALFYRFREHRKLRRAGLAGEVMVRLTGAQVQAFLGAIAPAVGDVEDGDPYAAERRLEGALLSFRSRLTG